MSRKRWDAVLSRLPEDTAIVGVEVGVFLGALSYQLLMKRPRLTLYMIDPWAVYGGHIKRDHTPKHLQHSQRELDGFHEKTKEAVRVFDGRGRVIRDFSLKVAEDFEDGSLDFAYIDGDHTYAAAGADLRTWLPKVKPGGWIGGHDYPKRKGVVRAVDEIFGTDFELDAEDTYFHRVRE